jgi:hypothetical protein
MNKRFDKRIKQVVAYDDTQFFSGKHMNLATEAPSNWPIPKQPYPNAIHRITRPLTAF